MKRFLLTAGLYYYPNAGDRDWIGCYASKQEAEEAYEQLRHERDSYAPDWYEIIDLGKWIFDKDIETSDEDE